MVSSDVIEFPELVAVLAMQRTGEGLRNQGMLTTKHCVLAQVAVDDLKARLLPWRHPMA